MIFSHKNLAVSVTVWGKDAVLLRVRWYFQNIVISVYNTCTPLLNNKKYKVDANLDAPDNKRYFG